MKPGMRQASPFFDSSPHAGSARLPPAAFDNATRIGRTSASLVALLLLLAAAACGSDDTRRALDRGGPTAPARIVVAADADPTGAADYLVDFGRIAPGAEADAALVLRNTGGKAATFVVTGIAAPFSLDHAGAGAIAPGATVELPLRFTPGAQGRFGTTLTLQSGGVASRIRLAGTAAVDPPAPECQLDVARNRLTWDHLAPGESFARLVEVTNVGEVDCDLALTVTGKGYSLETNRLTVAPGEWRETYVTWTATENESGEGRLLIAAGRKTWTIELLGMPMVDCLQLTTPAEMDLGTSQVCTASEWSVSVGNACAWAVGLVGLQIEGADVFGVKRQPAYPAIVEPGRSAAFTFVFTAIDPGDYTGVVRFLDDNDLGPSVSVRAGAAPLRRTDHFEMGRLPRVDTLFVIDDSPAMLPHREKLEGFLREFVSNARRYPMRVRTGFTTTSRLATDDCDGSGADGRLVPVDETGARWLETDADVPLEAWSDALARIRTCSGAPNEGFAAAWRALTELAALQDDPAHEDPNDGNAGFLRDGALLDIIFVSAGEDASGDSLQTWLERVDAIQRERAVHVTVGAIAPGCGAGRTRYQALAQARHGFVLDSCDPEWHAGYTDPSSPLVRTRFQLSAGVATYGTSDIEVRIDGEPLPAEAEDGTQHWAYDVDANAIDFAPGYAPFDGQTLDVEYPAGACW